jgi:hypothetical protein
MLVDHFFFLVWLLRKLTGKPDLATLWVKPLNLTERALWAELTYKF